MDLENKLLLRLIREGKVLVQELEKENQMAEFVRRKRRAKLKVGKPFITDARFTEYAGKVDISL